jgi:hypothetical protein
MDADAFLDQMEDLLDQGRMPVYVALDGAIVATAYEAKNKKGLPVVDS